MQAVPKPNVASSPASLEALAATAARELAAQALAGGTPGAAEAAWEHAGRELRALLHPRPGRLALVKPGTAPLEFTLFGGFELKRGGEPVDGSAWGRRLAQRLVRFLLVHRRAAVPEDELFDAFWSDRRPEAARRSLQVVVSCARSVLDAPDAPGTMIEVRERTYRLVLRDGDRVDVDRFESAALAALAAQGPARTRALERAAALWTGEPLPEDRYEDWSLAWRERIADVRAELLGALADARAEAGDWPAAAAAARGLVDTDPLDEASHRLLMAAYARAGMRERALRQYFECRRALIAELGVEPAAETAALQRRILDGDPV